MRAQARARSDDDDGSRDQSASSLHGEESRVGETVNDFEDEEDLGPTELVLTFERRGEGWGEELLPRAQFKRLPISRKDESGREPPRSLASPTSSSTSSTCSSASDH